MVLHGYLSYWVQETSEWTRVVQHALRDAAPFFHAVSALGDETFYIVKFALTYAAISTAMARQFCLLWALTFWLTNVIKDYLCLPRPTCTVYLDTRNTKEFGFPSGHTTNATGFALYVVLRFEGLFGPSAWLEAGAVAYIALIALARVVLGVHAVIDILGGLFLGATVAVNWTRIEPYVDAFSVDHYLVVVACLMVLATYVYPRRDSANPAWVDASTVLGVAAGFVLGDAWSPDCGLLALWVDSSLQFERWMLWAAALRFLAAFAGALVARLGTKWLLRKLDLQSVVFAKNFCSYAAISGSCVAAARVVSWWLPLACAPTLPLRV